MDYQTYKKFMASSIQDTLLDVTVGALVGVLSHLVHVIHVAVLDQRRALSSFFSSIVGASRLQIQRY